MSSITANVGVMVFWSEEESPVLRPVALRSTETANGMGRQAQIDGVSR